jgi:hypothetical protein
MTGAGPPLNRRIRRELDALRALGLIDGAQLERLRERYPTTRWDVAVLARWFTLLGVLGAGAGVLILATELVNVMRLAEVGLAVAVAGLIYLGRRLGQRAMPKTAAALELGASLALEGLTTVLAIDLSTGSKNWPALVGLQTALAFALAYALANRLVLIHACALCFTWFGAQTGYIAGWGAYWLEMNYPARFFLAGLAFCGVAFLHLRAKTVAVRGFARVYAHFGALIAHLAMWFFALFGYFGEAPDWHDNAGQRVAFSLAWAALSGLCVYGGIRLRQRLLRGYGLTFLIIDTYTAYFQFIAAHSAEVWWMHLLLAGGSLVALGLWLERRLKAVAPTAPGHHEEARQRVTDDAGAA